jgi:HEAT repeat protein
MAKAKSTTAKLAALRSLRGGCAATKLVEELRSALADASNLVVAEAAEIAGANHLAELTPDLVAAYDRCFDKPLKSDRLCRAKLAIAEALNELDVLQEDVFWRGARHVQLEPVWGGSQDTAASLRVACAFALVRIHAHAVLPFLVDMLNDPEKAARVGAAQALAYSESEAAGLLLRLKARVGDPEAEVIAECFSGLVKLKAEEGVTFVAEFLQAQNSAIQEAALVALGESRRPQAFEVLKAFWQTHPDGRIEETVLFALALLRLPQATDFLLEIVANESEALAKMAVSALAVHRYDARLRERAAVAVAKNGLSTLQAHFEKRFASDE